MTGVPLALLAAAWVACGAVIVVAALRAHRSAAARRTARRALCVLYVLFGAVVNAVFLATGTDYGSFADASPLPIVRDTWRSVVAPHQVAWIMLLVLFEAAVGILVASGGRRTVTALIAMIGFHLGLLSFGWGFWVWSLPMLAALGLLLRAELAAGSVAAQPGAGTKVPPGRSFVP